MCLFMVEGIKLSVCSPSTPLNKYIMYFKLVRTSASTSITQQNVIATVLLKSCVRGEVGALMNQPNSSVMCVFPGVWRSVLEGGC